MIFFRENFKFFKKAFLPLFILVVLSTCIDQYLSLQMESALSSSEGASHTVYILGFLSILFSILLPGFIMTTALFSLKSTYEQSLTLSEFLKKNLAQVYIELLRSWGKTLGWSLLLILPGLWKYIQYSFVPLVVTSSKDYDNGNLDALEASSQLFKNHWLKTLSILFIFQLFIPLVLSGIFSSYRILWQTPLQSLGLSILDTYFLILSIQLLFNIFKSEAPYEAHV